MRGMRVGSGLSLVLLLLLAGSVIAAWATAPQRLPASSTKQVLSPKEAHRARVQAKKAQRLQKALQERGGKVSKGLSKSIEHGAQRQAKLQARHDARLAAMKSGARTAKLAGAPRLLAADPAPANLLPPWYAANMVDMGGGQWPYSNVVAGDFGNGKLGAAEVVETYDSSSGDWYLNVSAALGNGDGTFQAPVVTPITNEWTGTYWLWTTGWVSLLAGDVDGDGKTDLLMFTYDESSYQLHLFVCLADPTTPGKFIPPADSIVVPDLYYAWDVADAKLLADGSLLIVLPAYTSSNGWAEYAVKLTNAGGVFTPGTPTLIPGIDTDYAVIADLNGDGIPDIAALNGSTVYIYQGQADGSFAPATPASYAMPSDFWGDYAITVGDVNGDGKPDIVAAGEYSVDVLKNNGDGTFQVGALNFAGYEPYELAVADVNGDGKGEILSFNGWTGDVSVLSAHGGLFTVPTFGYSIGGDWPWSKPLVADFNGDGKADIMLPAQEDTSLVTYLQGNGNGTFVGSRNLYTPGKEDYESYPYGVATGDFRGTGRQDIVAAAYWEYVTVWLSNADGTYQPGVNYYAPEDLYFVTTADIDGDGNVDIIATDWWYNVYVFLGYGDGTFTDPITFETNDEPSAVMAVDLNHDGKPDLVVYDGDYITIFKNTSTPGYPSFTGFLDSTAAFDSYELNWATYGEWMAMADVNGDGNLDVAVADGDYVDVLLGNGDGTFGNGDPTDYTNNIKETYIYAEASDSSWILGDCYGIALGKFNQSGNVDLAAACEDTDSNGMDYVGVWPGNNDGTFGSPTAFASTTMDPNVNDSSEPGDIRAVDVNGDGKLDLVYTLYEPALVAVRIGKGDGTFYDPALYPSVYEAWHMATADLHGNGVVGVVVGNYYEAPAVAVLGGIATTIPTVTTAAISAITGTTATGGGNVSADGGASVTARGVCWSTSANPTTALTTCTTNGSGTGTFTSSITGLTANTSYHVRAYATNSVGTAYGADVPFSTLAAPPDYSVSASPTSATIKAGSSANFTFTVTPTNGFNSAVSFSCGTLPKGVTCTFSPASVTPNGSPVTSTLTVQTSGATLTGQLGHRGMGLWASFALFGCVLAGAGARRRRWLIAGSIVVLLLLASLIGCGSSTKTPASITNPNATPTGTQTVTVNAIAGTTAHVMNVTITVQ